VNIKKNMGIHLCELGLR